MRTGQQRIETKISPDILDTIGNSFNFSHGKGIAEWLKNSLDNYLRRYELRQESRNGGWPLLLCLVDGPSASRGPNLGVIDFGGASYRDIEEFFLYWGSRSAATLGGQVEFLRVTGGHGNGGKFYMRQMWRNGARLLTWSKGRATSLVVEKTDDGTTGYWEMKDSQISWREAFEFGLSETDDLGGADYLLNWMAQEQSWLLNELDAQRRGFTIVAGQRAVQRLSANDVVRGGGRWDPQKLIDDILNAPQARRPIRELSISVFVNGVLRLPRLEPEAIQEDPDWPADTWSIPGDLAGSETGVQPPSLGQFTLRKAASELRGRARQYNTVYILDKNENPIAYYPLRELPLPGVSPMTSFLYGEARLDFPDLDELISNDRERLNNSSTTEAILTWISERIWQRIATFEEQQRRSERNSQLDLASVVNNSLNEHAQRFLEEIETEILVDFIEDNEGGGPGSGGSGVGPIGRTSTSKSSTRNGRGGSAGSGGSLEMPGTNESVRRPRFPRVLLSGYDADPASADGTTKYLTDRHPPLYQEDIDRAYNVWWINTSHPFAVTALARGGAQGAAFRSYQLFMFLQVVERETLRIRQRRDAEIGLDEVENEISEISNRFLAELPYELVGELLG